MASKSPGGSKKGTKSTTDSVETPDNSDSASSSRAGTFSKAASSLSQRVSLFGSGRKKSKNVKEGSESPAAAPTRLEVAYYGKRTDARDRSTEDPRRHAIPRANLSPTRSSGSTPEVKARAKLRKKSLEKERERRVSRERELEREKRRERSRSREKLAAEKTSSSTTNPLTSTSFHHHHRHHQSSSQEQRDSPKWSFKTETSLHEIESSVPPIPPVRRNRSPVKSTEEIHPSPKTSTPNKKTPYQFWKEHKVRDSRSEEKVLYAYEEVGQGAVRKVFHESEEVFVHEDPGSRPGDKADDILDRWKRERAKRDRERHGSGLSSASSSTAEPLSKVSIVSTHPSKAEKLTKMQSESVLQVQKSKDKDRKSSLSAMFHSLTKKKSKEDEGSDSEKQKKYSIAALMQNTALNPSFHDAVLHPADQETGNGSAKKSPDEPVLGTILHPKPPKIPGGPSTSQRSPFEEWRHYRGQRKTSEHPPTSGSHLEPPRRISAPTHSPMGLRAPTPDPDYDSISMSSAGSKSSRRGVDSSHEDLHRLVGPQYYTGSGYRSSSAMGIPRFVHRPASMLSASPRLERPLGASNESFGPTLASAESHQWYQGYSHEAFPHEAEFEDASFAGHNFDGRIHSIKGKKDLPNWQIMNYSISSKWRDCHLSKLFFRILSGRFVSLKRPTNVSSSLELLKRKIAGPKIQN